MTNVSPAMKRWIAVAGLALVVLLVIVFGARASGGGDDGGGTYRVRAIFDTASFLVPGEDVKVAGVKIGAIESLEVTPDHKAAVVLKITDPAFQDFRDDASCTIRLQSLIGEKFVACTPTQPRASNAQPAPPLRKIQHGDNKGQYLLPVENNSSPVDIDLLNDIMREPQRDRLAIIINELGVGLAGNGDKLRAVVRRADPAFEQFDRVLAILASQNRTLANLARDSDAALAGVGRQSTSVSDFVAKAGQTAAATAERGDALEASFERLPEFLRQLTPTARRLGEFAAAGTPVMTDLRAAAPSVDKIFEQLGPFSTAALPTFKTLGNAADISRKALVNSQPLIEDLSQLGTKAKPLASLLASGLTDLQGKRGIENLLNIILFLQGSGNGFDSVSHILRTYVTLPGSCVTLSITTNLDPNCQGTFNQGASASAAGDASASSADGETESGSTQQGTNTATVQPQDASTAAPSSTTESSSATSVQSGLLGYLLGTGADR